MTARDVTPDGTATTPEVGKVTAEQALREKSDHAHCTPACEAWQQRRELVMMPADEAAEFERDKPETPKRLRRMARRR